MTQDPAQITIRWTKWFAHCKVYRDGVWQATFRSSVDAHVYASELRKLS